MSFGAGKPDSNAMQELLKRNPLPHKAREVWFKALGCIPRLGPQAALAVSSSHASLGSLIAAYEAQPGCTFTHVIIQGIQEGSANTDRHCLAARCWPLLDFSAQ